MLTTRSERLSGGRVFKFAIDSDSAPISCASVIQRWQTDAGFRDYFIALLASSPFDAFRWETPPVTTASADRPFEFVLIDSPEIALDPDPAEFAAYFDGIEPGGVVEFPNLGGDAILVAPAPDAFRADFGHLAAFVRNASEAQQHRLWQAVGAAMQRRIGQRPVWLNTAGGGVAWLHVRLDDKPKYYAYDPYRRAA